MRCCVILANRAMSSVMEEINKFKMAGVLRYAVEACPMLLHAVPSGVNHFAFFKNSPSVSAIGKRFLAAATESPTAFITLFVVN